MHAIGEPPFLACHSASQKNLQNFVFPLVKFIKTIPNGSIKIDAQTPIVGFVSDLLSSGGILTAKSSRIGPIIAWSLKIPSCFPSGAGLSKATKTGCFLSFGLSPGGPLDLI